MLPNFELNPKHDWSASLIKMGADDYLSALELVKAIPYGRNSSKNDLSLILTENKGTCSTKHAFLVQLAQEYGIADVHLALGFYKMNGENTPHIGGILDGYDLPYIPEAHNYILYHDQRYDFTSSETEFNIPLDDMMSEMTILPNQICDFKQHFHRFYLINWLREQGFGLRFTIDEIWEIRELCIQQIGLMAA